MTAQIDFLWAPIERPYSRKALCQVTASAT